LTTEEEVTFCQDQRALISRTVKGLRWPEGRQHRRLRQQLSLAVTQTRADEMPMSSREQRKTYRNGKLRASSQP